MSFSIDLENEFLELIDTMKLQQKPFFNLAATGTLNLVLVIEHIHCINLSKFGDPKFSNQSISICFLKYLLTNLYLIKEVMLKRCI